MGTQMNRAERIAERVAVQLPATESQTLRDVVAEVDYASMGMTWEQAMRLATTYAAQCGYTVAEGGMSPDAEVSEDDGTLIILVMCEPQAYGVAGR